MWGGIKKSDELTSVRNFLKYQTQHTKCLLSSTSARFPKVHPLPPVNNMHQYKKKSTMCILIEPVNNDHPEPTMHISLLPPVHNTHLYTTSPQCSHPHHQSTMYTPIPPVHNDHPKPTMHISLLQTMEITSWTGGMEMYIVIYRMEMHIVD